MAKRRSAQLMKIMSSRRQKRMTSTGKTRLINRTLANKSLYHKARKHMTVTTRAFQPKTGKH
jgi:hypothetical protein